MAKKILLIICVVIFISPSLMQANSPSRGSLITSTTGVLTTGSKDTLLITSTSSISGDSTGIMMQFSSDSVSGNIYYQYITPEGYYASAYTTNVWKAFDCNVDSRAVFSEALPRLAGAYTINVYLIIQYDGIVPASKTITIKSYLITWR